MGSEEKERTLHTVYILQSLRNKRSYTGYTSKAVQDRLQEHNQGSNRWTKQNGPFVLKYYETYLCKKDALRREKFLKSGQGKKLKKIILEHF